jgi:hypothetical protein
MGRPAATGQEAPPLKGPVGVKRRVHALARTRAWQKPKAHSEARTKTDGEVGLRSFYLSGSGMPLPAYLAGL